MTTAIQDSPMTTEAELAAAADTTTESMLVRELVRQWRVSEAQLNLDMLDPANYAKSDAMTDDAHDHQAELEREILRHHHMSLFEIRDVIDLALHIAEMHDDLDAREGRLLHHARFGISLLIPNPLEQAELDSKAQGALQR